MTTLLCPRSAPKRALKALYRSRWQVELDIRHIKTTLGMDRLSCKTPETAEKEIWVYLLAYNLIRMLMMRSARSVDVLPRTLSFKHTAERWLAWVHYPAHDEQGPDFPVLLIMIAAQRVGQRGGRVEPRAVKRRSNTLPLLPKTRRDSHECR